MTRRSVPLVVACIAAVLVWPSAVAASEVHAYALHLTVDARGNGVARLDLSVTLTDQTLVVPLAAGHTTDLRVVKAPADSRVTLSSRDGRGVLVIDMLPGAGAVEISVEYGVPDAISMTTDGSPRTLRHQLLNTQATPIANYRVHVLFPAGWRAHVIREGQPRVRLGAIDGQAGAAFETASLKQGETATMRIELVQRHRSLGWFVVGLLLACGYLFSFRDLVRPAEH